MKGKLTGMSFRVPTPTVSVVDLTVKTVKETSYKEICAAMKKRQRDLPEGHPRLHRRTRSSRATSSTTSTRRSSTPARGIELNSNFFKLVSWYDNEWGYSNRCVDLLQYMIKKGS